MTWSLSATGEIKDIAGKALEDLERELFDAVGPILSRFGAFASSFGGRHITGAPHQTTSDAAAPAGGTTPDTGEDSATVTTVAPDPADTGTPFATGGIIPGDSHDDTTAQLPDATTYVPTPATPVDPPAADVPLPSAGPAPETEAATS